MYVNIRYPHLNKRILNRSTGISYYLWEHQRWPARHWKYTDFNIRRPYNPQTTPHQDASLPHATCPIPTVHTPRSYCSTTHLATPSDTTAHPTVHPDPYKTTPYRLHFPHVKPPPHDRHTTVTSRLLTSYVVSTCDTNDWMPSDPITNIILQDTPQLWRNCQL